jgi:phosphoribosyl-ATP pyrophosphohydrolase
MAQKVGEEATEVVIAALAAHHARDPGGEKPGKGKGMSPADPRDSGTPLPAPEAPGRGSDRKQRLVEEASDLLFHLLVLLRASGVTTTDLASELSARHLARARASEDGCTPLLKAEAPVAAVPPGPSEPTASRSQGK